MTTVLAVLLATVLFAMAQNAPELPAVAFAGAAVVGLWAAVETWAGGTHG